MPAPKRQLSNSRRATILLLAVPVLFFLFWFSYSFARLNFRNESSHLSRPLEIGQFDYGFSSNVSHHIIAVKVPGQSAAAGQSDSNTAARSFSSSQDSLLVAAVNGENLSLLSLTSDGTIRTQWTLPFDLSYSVDMAMFAVSSTKVRLFYKTVDLYSIDIELTGEQAVAGSALLVSRAIGDMKSDGPLLAYASRDGIRGIDMSPENYDGSEGELLYSGRFENFEITYRSEQISDFPYDRLVTISSQSQTGDEFSTWVYGANDFAPVSQMPLQFLLQPAGRSDLLRHISDVRLSEDTLRVAYLFQDDRFFVNHMTIRAVSTEHLLGEPEAGNDDVMQMYLELPYYKSAYHLMTAEELKAITENSFAQNSDISAGGLLFQTSGLQGPDLAVIALNETDESAPVQLTMSRYYSRFSGLYNLDGYQVLLYSDLRDDYRRLYLASDNEILISQTHPLTREEYANTLSMTALMLLASLPVGFLYFAGMSAVPAVGAAVWDRLPSDRLRKSIWGTIVTTGFLGAFKMLAFSMLLERPANSVFSPLFYSSRPLLFTLGLASVVLSLVAARLWYRDYDDEARSNLRILLTTSAMDLFITSPMFLMYIAASLLIAQV